MEGIDGSHEQNPGFHASQGLISVCVFTVVIFMYFFCSTETINALLRGDESPANVLTVIE